jgi:predicted ATPase
MEDMRISLVGLNHFRRFTDLKITDIAETVRLVVLAGPNGCGKSSVFDALLLWYQMHAAYGWSDDKSYYYKPSDLTREMDKRVQVEFHGDKKVEKGSFYFRSAYRNDPEFSLGNLTQIPPVTNAVRFRRMIDGDTVVTQNYQRLVSAAIEDVFATESETTTIGQFRERVIGTLRDSIKHLFPELVLNNLGNPLVQATFRFNKGPSSGFDYKNLSGGEKAAFDLILDIVVNKSSFKDAVYCIDEPDAHMNTRLQGALLGELYKLLPKESQLWVATHSIGMMRKARELGAQTPGSVAFLDFGNRDFDQPVVIRPSRPTRAFWEGVLNVALDDLATLIAPKEVVICEGNPVGAIPGKNAAHDARVYNTIFGAELPDVKFLAGGNANAVATDRLGFVAALPLVASGITVRRLIDRDDHAPQDIAKFVTEGITTLGRRHLEAYLYDDEVLMALCDAFGKPAEAPNLLSDKQQAIAASVARGNPVDDIKSAAGDIYVKAKQRLGLTGVGNDQMSFARNTLAPLLKPGMTVYGELKRIIFGP